MVFGTFDLLHPGHLNLFEQALAHGDRLIAIVARDKNVEKIKGKTPSWNEQKRVDTINKQCLDKNIQAELGDLYDFYSGIKKHQPDLIALGYDQRIDDKNLSKELQLIGLEPKIIRLKAHKPEIYKSSLMIKDQTCYDG